MAKTKTPAPKVNVFAKAKANPVKGPQGTKAEAAPVEIVGLTEFACMAALKTQIEATMKTGLRPGLDAQIYDAFIKNRGETFKAVEEGSTESTIVHARRTSSSGLKEDEMSLLEKHNIPTARIEGDFKLNVEGVSEEKLQEVSDAISKIKDLPENFISFDASKARTIVTEESITKLYLINDVEVQKQLMKVILSPMIKPKTTAKMNKILKVVADLLAEEDEEA